MTTNHAEKLDTALIRPGRVDFHFKFENATREQAKAIFIRMYGTEGEVTSLSNMPDKELNRLAERFTSYFNDLQFSPAQIQGFLFKYKNDPCRAVESVKDWIGTEDANR
ncbi:hypothetical protein F5Y02DRAFT_259464 [Annulohypoxylon stygium]|nr:hypothetical protein F5Y02DRAFT_259464 [Annulohypoxylon stygium]